MGVNKVCPRDRIARVLAPVVGNGRWYFRKVAPVVCRAVSQNVAETLLTELTSCSSFVLMITGYPISAKLPDELGIGERFWYWIGASGKSYIHSIYPAGACPPLPGAVYLIVCRRDDGRRIVKGVGVFPEVWGASCGIDVADGDEIHVHLLARGYQASGAVLGDLRAAMDGVMPDAVMATNIPVLNLLSA